MGVRLVRDRIAELMQMASGSASCPSLVTRCGTAPVTAFADRKNAWPWPARSALAQHHVNRRTIAIDGPGEIAIVLGP